MKRTGQTILKLYRLKQFMAIFEKSQLPHKHLFPSLLLRKENDAYMQTHLDSVAIHHLSTDLYS